MARWLITFGVLIVLGSLCWPWLHAFGLSALPGDLLVDFVPGSASSCRSPPRC